MTRLFKFVACTSLAAALTACASTPGEGSDATAASNAPVSVMELPAETLMTVGGADMSSNKTIVENASAADNLTTLVALVKQAQLVETLSGPGPFTVFAPTDDAFSIVPEATRNSLMLDENRAALQNVLTYHVIGSRLTADDLMFNVERNGGSFETTTVNGQKLRFFISGGKLKITDGNRRVATVTTGDVMQSNGVVHVVNSVLMPE